MTALPLCDLRGKLHECYKLLFEDSIKPIETLMSTPAMEESTMQELVHLRVKELGGRLQDYGKILESELNHFKEKLSTHSGAVDVFASKISTEIVNCIRREGTKQIIKLLKWSSPTSRLEIRQIVEHMHTAFMVMGLRMPVHPINKEALPHIEMAIHEYNVQIGKELQTRASYLNTQFFGGEKELGTPTLDTITRLAELAFSGIRSEFDDKITLLQKTGMLEAVLDDSSPYSACWARRRLEKLNELHKTLYTRICMPCKKSAEEQEFLLGLVKITSSPSVNVVCMDYIPLELTIRYSPGDLENILRLKRVTCL